MDKALSEFVDSRGRMVDSKFVTVLPHKVVRLHKPAHGSTLILCLDPGSKEEVVVFYEHRYSRCVRLEFDDVDEACSGTTLFHEQQAHIILDAFDDFLTGNLVVSCTGGVARSAAIAAAYCELKGNKESRDFFLGSADSVDLDCSSMFTAPPGKSPFLANRYVYNTLLDVAAKRIAQCQPT